MTTIVDVDLRIKIYDISRYYHRFMRLISYDFHFIHRWWIYVLYTHISIESLSQDLLLSNLSVPILLKFPLSTFASTLCTSIFSVARLIIKVDKPYWIL